MDSPIPCSAVNCASAVTAPVIMPNGTAPGSSGSMTRMPAIQSRHFPAFTSLIRLSVTGASWHLSLQRSARNRTWRLRRRFQEKSPREFLHGGLVFDRCARLTRKSRFPHEEQVYLAGSLAALADGPYDKRLAAAHIAGREDLVEARRVGCRVGRDIAALVEFDAQF